MSEARERWNTRHAEAIAGPHADRPPADWVAEHADVLTAQPRGRVLDVAAGRGRNALFLAGLGFEVEALDVSDVALAHLHRRARERGLAIRTRRADLSRAPLPPGPYEIVLNTFYYEPRLFGPMRDALAPGGLLLVVGFLEDPADPGRFRMRPGELREAFAGLDLLAYFEGPPDPDSRPRANLLARRPLDGSRLEAP